ncbi:MAG: C-terminal binding protein [Spirochaetaceae bacterium]|nr:MAG: C-terminal binding protein [Spirochaetaceae bacterium]
MKRVVFAGDRLFRKFPDREYFADRLREIGAECEFAEGADDTELRRSAADAAAMVVIDRRIDRELLQGMKRPELIMTLSVGYDCVDVAAATELGIPVSNCPTYCIDEVATHALTLLHAVGRKLHLVLPETKQGNWYVNYAKPINAFGGRTVGIIGLGRIGRAFARKLAATGVRIAAYDPYVDDDVFEMVGAVRVLDLEDLLPQCDYVSIHAPLTGETVHMINARTLALMKPEAFLINTARGAIIDEADLLAALQAERIAGAALDVLENEPPAADHPLLHEPRVLVTPHMAWYTEESHLKNQQLGMQELTRVLSGRRPQYIVNPQILQR